ncbi:MAG: lipoyl protein ligase domain-containing protein [Synechococcus sp.]
MPALPTTPSCRPTPPCGGLLLPQMELEGPQHMALDAWLLDQCVQGALPSPLLRFYTWSGAWLSLGHHQQALPAAWKMLEQTGRLRRVRRPSGGGAVLHAGGLTYALIWPHAPRRGRTAYQTTSQWLIQSFAQLGLTLQVGQATATAGSAHCFGSATGADLIDSRGHKRIGSAQFWRRGHLLQHGEILLHPPEALWRDLFDSDPPPVLEGLTSEGVTTSLTASLPLIWPGLSWTPHRLDSSQWDAIRGWAERYRLSGDGDGSSSSNPEACIEATACTKGKPNG